MDDLFRGRLLSGERILWSGAPGQGFLFTSRDIYMVPFSLLWCGFAIFWEFVAIAKGGFGFSIVWGAAFVCVGLYLVVGRFLVDAWLRRGLRYAVTDRRILIARPAPFSRFVAINLKQLPDLDLKERGNGSGTILFGRPISRWGNQSSSWTPALDPTPQFIAIDDAQRIFDLIQRTATP